MADNDLNFTYEYGLYSHFVKKESHQENHDSAPMIPYTYEFFFGIGNDCKETVSYVRHDQASDEMDWN